MSKERLEEIKQYLMHFYNAVDVEEDIKIYIFNTLKIEWLIKQAERVQELEEDCEYLSHYYELETEQNERYREVIKKAIDDLENECLWDALVALKALEGKQ